MEIEKNFIAIGRDVRLMEVCGTHTVAIFRHGIRALLPTGIRLLSGPGCPVCVTSIRDIDTIINLSGEKDIIITTFGDMMRVPGSIKSLSDAKAEGADIRVVYSPLDALAMAEKYYDKKVVFFATGFETTSPSVAATILEAEEKGLKNFYIYSAHKTMPPALKTLLMSGEVNVDGFILPGHVSTIIGTHPYRFISKEYRKPSVVTGFNAADIMTGILMILNQIVVGKAEVLNQYKRVVRDEGNIKANMILERVFEPADAYWRGIGMIPYSGLRLRKEWNHRDIMSFNQVVVSYGKEPTDCSCGEVLKGIMLPVECKLFGSVCTPNKPVGPCMVSSEGSCSAYYRYSFSVR